MSGPIAMNLQLNVRIGRAAEAEKLIGDLIASTKKEGGAQDYLFYMAPDKGTCHVVERYNSSEALLVHLGNFGAFVERFMEFLEPTSLSIYGDPSDELREALAGWGPVYLQEAGGFRR